MSVARCAWFRDEAILQQMPRRLRLLAAYCRVVADRRTGIARGGSFLHRRLAEATKRFGLPRIYSLRVDDVIVHLDVADPRQFWVIDEVSREGGVRESLRAVLLPGDTFIDIGANHGGFSLSAIELVGADGKIIAVEPQPRLADAVRKSLRASGACTFDVIEVAISDEDGTATLVVPATNSGAANLFGGGCAADERLQVKTIRLDDAVDWRKLPGEIVLKIDVEGSEERVLDGARALIEARRPTILFELSPQNLALAGSSPTRLLRRLESLGYQEFVPIQDRAQPGTAASIDLSRQQNILAIGTRAWKPAPFAS